MASIPTLRTSDLNIKYFDFVVRADGKGTHQTIVDAMEAASLLPGQQCVFVSPGVYNEDLFLYSNVSLLSLGVPATRVLEEGSVLETGAPLDGAIPDLAEPIIRGNHTIFYSVDEVGDVVRSHSVVYDSIRFESANTDKPIINLHNTSQTVNSIIYNSVIEFKDCTISQIEIGAPTAMQAIACPPENMFSRLSLSLNNCTFILSTNECFLFSSNTTDPEGVAGNIFNFEDCKCFNIQDLVANFPYMQINGCNVWVKDSHLGYLSYCFNSEDQSCSFVGYNSILLTANQYIFIESAVEGATGASSINLNKCQLSTNSPPEGPIKEYFYGDYNVMEANLTDCTLIDRPTSLVSGLVSVSITNTLSTSMAYTGDITFDGVKIKGALGGSGDGLGADTIELVPDVDLYAAHQYLVIDPTGPDHIHIRAGGPQDNSDATLILGGERTAVQVSDETGNVYIISKNPDQLRNLGNSGTGNEQFIHSTAIDPPIDIVVGDTVQLYPDGDLFTVTEVTEGESSITVVADGLTFMSGYEYIFHRNQGENVWTFNNDGRISLPTKTMPGYYAGYTLSGSTLQLGAAGSETIITGPTPNSVTPNAERFIIQGQQGYAQGEGGDVYLWAGCGNDDLADPLTEAGPGGDAKVRGGYSYGIADAGYVNIEGGWAQGSGAGGHINIEGGRAQGVGAGGYVNIKGGYANSTGDGGKVWIKGANSNSGIGGDVELEAGTGATAGAIKITNGDYTWNFDNNKKLNFPGSQNSQSFNKANGSLVIGDTETGVAWTGNEYISTAKVILQAEYDNGSSWRTHSCEVLVIRKKLSDTVNHIVYGAVYTDDPLFTLSTTVVDGMTILSIANLDGGYLHVSTFVTEIGTCS